MADNENNEPIFNFQDVLNQQNISNNQEENQQEETYPDSFEIGYKIYKSEQDGSVNDKLYAKVAEYCNQTQDRTIQDKGEYFEVIPIIHQITVDDYDRIMEEHLRNQRTVRGYTLRQPSDYIDSTVERWKQDAIDWIAHRDAVMLYGLQVQNNYKETNQAPTLEEFRANLPVISWTISE